MAGYFLVDVRLQLYCGTVKPVSVLKISAPIDINCASFYFVYTYVYSHISKNLVIYRCLIFQVPYLLISNNAFSCQARVYPSFPLTWT